MVTNTKAEQGSSGAKDVQAVQSTKPLIEGVYFKGARHTIARVRYASTKENEVSKVRFEIDLADDKQRSYRPHFFIGVQEDEKRRSYFGGHESYEYSYYFKDLAGGPTRYGNGFSTKPPINQKNLLETLAFAAEQLRDQLIYKLPSRNTPESRAHSDEVKRDLIIAASIVIVARHEVGHELEAAKALLRDSIPYRHPGINMGPFMF